MAYVRVPPDGAGKKVHSKSHTVGADAVETQVVHLADRTDPSNQLAVDNRGSASVRFAEGQPILAGFGSLKTTGERALGVYETSLETYDELFSVEAVSGGASNYQPVTSSTVLAVTASSGSSVTRTTNRYHYYQPGSSNYVKMTIGCTDTGKAGNRRRWGAFDDDDGLFFELDGMTLNVVIRSSTGTAVETKVPQSAWNHDKADGTGLSGLTLNIANINVYWLDYQWLGAGRVRFGCFAPTGERIVLHAFENAGTHPQAYMRTGTLPLRTQNVNHATTSGSSELREGCLAIYTEGTFEDYAFWRAADMEALGVTVTTDTHMFSVQSKVLINGKHNHVITYPETLNVYCTGPVAITLWQNTTVNSGSWSMTSDSSIDGTTNGSLVYSSARKFKTLYFDTGARSVSLSEYFELNDEGIMCAANGVPEIWSVVATRLTANATTASVNLGYRELW